MTAPEAVTVDTLARPGLRHGFFGRRGGVSTGIYASLNCGPGSRDDRAAVQENRARAAATLGLPGPEAVVSAYQVHSDRVARVTGPWHGAVPEVDGMVTDRPGIALGVLAADCAPLLFADPDAGVIGAAHAGWRGALDGIADATVTAMTALGAQRERIRAAIGPCIGPASYEVGREFEARFVEADADNARFFAPGTRDGHPHFDLPGYLEARLRGLGLAAVATVGHDTYAEPNRYFSYRQARRRGEEDYGRNLSAIVLRP